ncbi:MAG TPA: endo-1,4-beta-xylanase [Terracidiphilus sp.]|nr:endo-1,4-beta-xylanase [Terracidiphilus sp.]
MGRWAFCSLLTVVIACGSGRFLTAQSRSTSETLREAAQKHDLLMGAAADSHSLVEPLYASTLATEYSQLEPENEMKFGPIHPQPNTYNFAGPDALVAFARAHSMKVRGHNLVWHEQLPGWLYSNPVPWTPAGLNKVLENHIATVVGHFKGEVYAWDVVNEPFNDDGTIRSTIWYDKPGIGFAGQGTKTIEQALRWAHAADPNAKLFVNEYGADQISSRKSDALYAMARDFKKRGVPLSGIGFEMHTSTGFDRPDSLNSLKENLRRFAALGLEVQFTEVDVQLRDGSAVSLKAEADTYRDLLSICLRQPACTAFQTWGFTDKHSWIPHEYHGYGWALPFDQNYKPKPAFYAMLKELESRGNTGPRPSQSR